MWPVSRADNLATFMCRLSRNAGSLSRPVQGDLYLYLRNYSTNYVVGQIQLGSFCFDITTALHETVGFRLG